MVKPSVEAKLVGAHSANEVIPIQLFFYPFENENWRGKFFTLAHVLETVPDASSKARVDAIIALLNRGTPDGSGGIDIRAEFKTKGASTFPRSRSGANRQAARGAPGNHLVDRGRRQAPRQARAPAHVRRRAHEQSDGLPVHHQTHTPAAGIPADGAQGSDPDTLARSWPPASTGAASTTSPR